MARSTTKAAPPRKHIADKEPTALHEGFVEWLKKETGYDADPKSVQLACVLRMDYQRSEENQARLASNKTAREQAETERQQAREARAAKAKEKEAAKASKTTASKSTASKTTASKTATAPAKKAAPARRRAAKKTSTPASGESFE